MNNKYENFFKFLAAHKDDIFRYWIFKKMFTPYEQAGKFPDESIYENLEANYGKIAEAVVLPDNDILLGFTMEDGDDKYLEYHKLSSIDLALSESDQEEIPNE